MEFIDQSNTSTVSTYNFLHPNCTLMWTSTHWALAARKGESHHFLFVWLRLQCIFRSKMDTSKLNFSGRGSNSKIFFKGVEWCSTPSPFHLCTHICALFECESVKSKYPVYLKDRLSMERFLWVLRVTYL